VRHGFQVLSCPGKRNCCEITAIRDKEDLSQAGQSCPRIGLEGALVDVSDISCVSALGKVVI
jgi:hypothetical protein